MDVMVGVSHNTPMFLNYGHFLDFLRTVYYWLLIIDVKKVQLAGLPTVRSVCSGWNSKLSTVRRIYTF